MDLGFIHPFLSLYDFNSDLEGCYKEGLYENLNGKAYGGENALYIELDLPDPEFLPSENPLSGSLKNQFQSVSDLKEISAQSWGHIEAFGDTISPKTSSQQPCSWSTMT